MTRPQFFALLIFFTSILFSSKASMACQEIETQEDLLKEIDEYATKVHAEWNVPGMAVAIVKDGQVIFSKGYGVRELGVEGEIDGDTLFCVASNSKAFTAAALAVLVDRKQIAWDDPVSKYVPEFQMPDAYPTQQMTVRDLVCHRSGLDTFSGDLLWFGTNYSADEVIARIPKLKPVSSFRSRYGYQNLMFVVAGKVIERVSKQTWAAFVQTEFLIPLHMDRTTTSVTTMKDNFALPHNESGGNGMRSFPVRNLDNCWGACGLNSSVNDMAKWMNLLLANGSIDDKSIISKAQVWAMMQPYTVMQLSPVAAAANPHRHFQAYGLGFFLHDYHDRKIVHHSGGMDGMISQLAIVPEENLGVVVLTNSESSASRFVRERVIDCFLDVKNRPDASGTAIAAQAAADQRNAEAREKKNASRVSDTKPSLNLEKYATRFRSDLYGDVTVSIEGDHLVMRFEPAAELVADLQHWHYDTFEIKWRDSVTYNFPRGWVTFSVDSEGLPHQLIIDQPNDDFWFYELDLFRVK